MNAALPMEAKLSLYADTKSTASGQYFCNDRMFALPVMGNQVETLTSGEQVFSQILQAMNSATRFIWIADWQMAFDVELADRGKGSRDPHSGRLIKVIENIIKNKPVQIRVLLYGSIADKLPGTYDALVANALNAINNKAWPGKVIVMRQGPTSAQLDAIDYSHHQKFVVVDGRIAFLGGIDLAYGRFESPEFDVVIDPSFRVLNESYNPCATKARKLTSSELELVDIGFAKPYSGAMLEEGCQARMPWQDVHIKITGPAVVDVHRNFVRRWNAHVRAEREAMLKAVAVGVAAAQSKGMVVPLSAPTTAKTETARQPCEIDSAWLDIHGATALLKEAAASRPGAALVQIVRSVSSRHLKAETYPHGKFKSPDDLNLLLKPGEREVFEEALQQWQGQHQDNILNAMVNCIRSADNYIYIETQFFISNFGTYGEPQTEATDMGTFTYYPVDSRIIGNENNGIKNTILDALAERIETHIVAGTQFHVYLVLPVHPEGSIADGSIWKQHWMALASIHHGSRSLIGRIKLALQARKRSASEWNKYLTVLNMRNYGVAVQYARDPKTFDENFNQEIGRYVITEQIYVHSKLLIVDDAVAIVGSANINDRSLTGNGDSEIAAVVVDTQDVRPQQDLGDPKFKVVTRKFARDLRRSLWEKHFGLSLNQQRYFRTVVRAEREHAIIRADVPHPPRNNFAENQVFKAGGGKQQWQEILNKPCHPNTVAAIQAIAARNRDAYETVFTHTPRNGMRSFQDILKYHTVTYSVLAGNIARNMIVEGDLEHARAKSSIQSTNAPADRRAALLKNEDSRHVERMTREPVVSRKTLGVVPPALQKQFMTTDLMPHQRESVHAPLSDFQNRYVTYEGGAVHNVASAIVHLRDFVVGFWVLMPLNWGEGAEVDGSIDNFRSVDLADAKLSTTGPKSSETT